MGTSNSTFPRGVVGALDVLDYLLAEAIPFEGKGVFKNEMCGEEKDFSSATDGAIASTCPCSSFSQPFKITVIDDDRVPDV